MTSRKLKRTLNLPVNESDASIHSYSEAVAASSTPLHTCMHTTSELGNKKRKRNKATAVADSNQPETLVVVRALSSFNHPSLLHCNIGSRLLDNFFDVPCEVLARGLLGQILVRTLSDGNTLRCRIVETECYLGGEDKASHSYNGRVTEGNKPMYMKPGTSYVYFTYGMYHCFNISSQGAGAAVLLRAAEPLEGLETMQLHRQAHRKGGKLQQLKPHELCNGPSKLCMSLAIERFTCNRQDLSQWDGMWFEKGMEDSDRPAVVVTHRVGIDRVEAEWRLKPLRFYLLGNSSVSKRDKVGEQSLISSTH